LQFCNFAYIEFADTAVILGFAICKIKFPVTALKFPVLRNIFPVNSRREFLQKSLRHNSWGDGCDQHWVASQAVRRSDASVFPVVPCANTNFPILMAAEKIADAMR
jgi:hypothetical protein